MKKDKNYTLRIVTLIVVCLAAIWWLPIGIVTRTMHPALRVAAIIAGILAFISLFDRDMYLPFLAESVIPYATLTVTQESGKMKTKPEDTVVTLRNLPPHSKIIFWAAENGDPRTRDTQMQMWRQAYGTFSNSGIVKANAEGIAQLVIKCPQKYFVKRLGFKKTLNPHVHYRYVTPDSGIISEVKTHNIQCQYHGN